MIKNWKKLKKSETNCNKNVAKIDDECEKNIWKRKLKKIQKTIEN